MVTNLMIRERLLQMGTIGPRQPFAEWLGPYIRNGDDARRTKQFHKTLEFQIRMPNAKKSIHDDFQIGLQIFPACLGLFSFAFSYLHFNLSRFHNSRRPTGFQMRVPSWKWFCWTGPEWAKHSAWPAR
jgi:hypothetical protein